MAKNSQYLLPDSTVPKHYDVRLTPDLDTFTFAGRVAIQCINRRQVREITLHAADLEISKVDAWCFTEEDPIRAQEIRMDAQAQTATFIFGEALPAGTLTLDIEYSGTLNDKMAGFYRSKYIGADGQEKYLATTQFEATDARRALPCWDEPARKATFDVTLIVPSTMTALSNMPVSSKHMRGDGLLQVDFDQSPVMSTYLLAFIVGEFAHAERLTSNGTQVRVYTLPGKSEQGAFALDVAVRTLEFYNGYFGIPYPLPKLDMVAIPDFAAGAMENWGLVTYRENAVLIDPANSSAAAYQRVAEVVAHELAHQWFGNLVTMQWWTHLWLNEGFATWMANFALDHLFPEWDIWTQFVGDDYASALSLDGLRSTHAIEVEVGHPDEISQIFDAISYSKGSCVIRMIHDYIGAEAFRTGLQSYLKKHAYGNATTEDLWQALGEASELAVCDIMDTWTKQPGYPLMSVYLNGMSYQRFLASGEPLTPQEQQQMWHIPSIAPRGLKHNPGQIILARFNYPPDQWLELAEAVRNMQLPPIDRYGLASDALALTRAGHIRTAQLVPLLRAYANEDNCTVWTAVLGAIGALDSITEETPDAPRLASFARTLLEPIAEKLGWDEKPNESHTTKLLRGMVLGALGGYGHNPTIAQAASSFDESLRCGSLNPNLRAAIYGMLAKRGNSEMLNTFIGLYEGQSLQEEKVRLLNAMGRFTNPFVLPLVLGYAFNKERVRPGDFVYVVSAMGSHATGRYAAWNFLTTNWDIVSERYASGGLMMLGRIVSLVCDGFTRADDADTLEQFFKDHPAPSATRAVSEAAERIRVRAAWYQRDKDQITAALAP